MDVKIQVLDSFSTYTDFEEYFTQYKKSVQQEYWIRDARTIANQRKRFPETVSKASEDLKYYYLRLSCVKGGRTFKTRNENSTRNCTTQRQDCPATIFLKVSPCQKALVVMEVNEEHNHSTSDTASLQEAKDAKKARAKKKIVLGKKRNETGSKLVIKDLSRSEDITQNASDEEIFDADNTLEMSNESFTEMAETEVLYETQNNNSKATSNSHMKFAIMYGHGKRMAQLCSGVSTNVFFKRANFIEKIIEMWEEENDSASNEDFSRIFESDIELRQEMHFHCEEHSDSQESTNENRRNILKRARPRGSSNTVTGLKRQKSTKVKTTEAETEQLQEMKEELKEEYLEEYLDEYLDDEV